MTGKHVLLVEDEEDIQQLVEYNLLKEGYTVTCATTGEQALELTRTEQPDLILLDLMLPAMDGLQVCRNLKKDPSTETIPVVILTAKGEESDILTGFNLGADDYVTKPFSPRVLLARVAAVLRRGGRPAQAKDAVTRLGDLVIDPGRHEVRVQD
ncbi:MAG: response regulator, partial [Candidatus Eisenbacteria bacterium]|nr:response regulator [Candidatus Eisenbacteria bacterium]